MRYVRHRPSGPVSEAALFRANYSWWNLAWIFGLLWIVSYFVRENLANSIRDTLSKGSGSSGFLLSKKDGKWTFVEDGPQVSLDGDEGAQIFATYARSQGRTSPQDWFWDVSPYETTRVTMRWNGPPSWLSRDAKRLASTIANGGNPWPGEVSIDPSLLRVPGLYGDAITMIHEGKLEKTRWNWQLFLITVLFGCQWVFLVIAVVSLRFSYRVRRLYMRIERNVCPICEYPLVPDHPCPECGTLCVRDRGPMHAPPNAP